MKAIVTAKASLLSPSRINMAFDNGCVVHAVDGKSIIVMDPRGNTLLFRDYFDGVALAESIQTALEYKP